MAEERPWTETTQRLLARRRLRVPWLAAQIGEPQRTVRDWLRGVAKPQDSLDAVRRIAKALDVPLWWLLEPIGEEPPQRTRMADMLRLFDERIRPLVLATFDADASAYLLRMLEEYRRLRETTAPNAPRGPTPRSGSR